MVNARKRLLAAAAATVASLIAASAASAADFYVDRDVAVGNPACLIADPCKTVGEALTQSAGNGSSTMDVIHIGRSIGTYGPIAPSDQAITLLGNDYDFTGGGPAISIVDGVTAKGIDLTGSQPKIVRDLRIRGGDSTPAIDGSLGGTATNVTIEDNTFDDDGADVDYQLDLDGSPLITGNTFTGSDDNTGPVVGLRVFPAGAPTITGNDLTGLERSIDLTNTSLSDGATVSRNTIEVKRTDLSPTWGIGLNKITGLIADNEITGVDSAVMGLAPSSGIYAIHTDASSQPLHLRHNEIRALPGPSAGVTLVNNAPTILEGDVITGSKYGINTSTNSPSATLNGVTLWGAGSDEIFAVDTAFTIDSSIIGAAGVSLAGAATCTSSFSRSPAPSTCGFTVATPSFVDSLNGDYHLTPTANAAFIDQGNPASPGSALDIDGQPRALDGLADAICAPRRDIGADEVSGVAGANDCPPPAPAGASPQGAAKKCPKGKKLVRKKGKKKCVKKKRKR